MNIVEKNISVNMECKDLGNIPYFPVPDSYTIRWYQPGYEDLWIQIQSVADKYSVITADLFRREFGEDPKALSERQCFLFDHENVAVGTNTAWLDNDYHGEKYGRIHWVAIVPSSQGQGLSKPLLAVACRRLRDLGHAKAYLVTSTARIAAINLYLSFGFVPDIRKTDDAHIWAELKPYLKVSNI